MSARTDAIVEWLRQRLHQPGARGFVVGLSGGIDSAVVARLCQAAAPANVVGVIMPCHSDPQDEADARLVADHFRIPTIRIDLAPTYDRFTATLPRQALTELPAEQVPDAAARVRGPQGEAAARQRQAAAADDDAVFRRQHAELHGRRHRQPQRARRSATSRSTATAAWTCCRSATC